MSKRFKKINTQSYELNTVQENVASTLDAVSTLPLVNGNLLENVSLAIGDNSVSHGLDRLRGWIIVRRDGVSDIYDKQETNLLKQRTLELNSSAAVTVSIWVF